MDCAKASLALVMRVWLGNRAEAEREQCLFVGDIDTTAGKMMSRLSL